MIPVWLTNRDVLTPIRGMLEHLLRCDAVGPITIVDCGSSYGPLLKWYSSSCPCRVIRAENLGNRAAWQYIEQNDGFYFASDADLDLSAVPLDFLIVLRDGLQRHCGALKSGLSLKIDDLPADSAIAREVVADESRYWRYPTHDDRWFAANLDTTAAMYRGGSGWGGYGPAIRSAPPYTARHLPWYLTPETITEEWKYYFEHMSTRGLKWGPILRDSFRS